MLRNNDIVSIQENLIARNYDQLLSNLRKIGLPIKQAWLNSPLSDNVEKYKFTSNPVFKEFLLEEIETSKILKSSNIQNISQLNQLKNQLSGLAFFLILWKDNANLTSEIEQLNLSETEKKKLHQLIKYKALLDKDDRYAINIALQTMTFILCQQINNIIKEQEKTGEIFAKDFYWKNSTNFFKILDNKSKLIKYISAHISKINNFKSLRGLDVTNHELTSDQNLQEIEKLGRAISSFQTPNKKKKLLKYFGISLAFITALACGLSTGGALFLLLPGSIVIPCIVGGLLFGFAFKSNYSFFSQNFPDFLLSLAKKCGISEFIDQAGERKQLTNIHKWGTLPLIGLISLAGGMATTALTYLAMLNLVTTFLPILAVLWPPLPLIIVGFLAVVLGITLTVSSFTANIDKFKKYLSQNTDENQLTFIEKLKALRLSQGITFILTGVLMLAALLGLAYYRITAGIDLSSFTGIILSGIISTVAFFAQIAFTVNAIHKLKYAVTSKIDNTKSIFSRVGTWICLVGNAVGNACLAALSALLAPHPIIPLPLVISGSVLCGLNSLAGNIPEQDINRPERSRATQALVEEVASFNTRTKPDASASTYDFDLDKTQQPLKFSLNTNSGSYPQESNTVNLPSPTGSENELLTKTANNEYARGGAHFFQTAAATSTAKPNYENRLVANR